MRSCDDFPIILTLLLSVGKGPRQAIPRPAEDREGGTGSYLQSCFSIDLSLESDALYRPET